MAPSRCPCWDSPDKAFKTILIIPLRYFLPSVVCFVPLTSCQVERPVELHEFTGLTMGTSWSVLINAEALPLPSQQLEAQFHSILDRVNGEMSTYLPDSDLSMINAVDSIGRISVSRSLMQVLQAARELSRLTQGGFDITVGSLVNLWGFGPERGFTVPGEEQLDAALRLVGYGYLRLDPVASTVKKVHDGVSIDLSAIAKGHGVDRIADYLDDLQLEDYMVEIGGEIRARGVNGAQATWRIGIEQPVAGQRNVRRGVRLENTAMATSGDYRNYFEQDGTRYSHTIDPRTGRPISHGLASVTVLHPSAMLADAWATGLLVLGPEQGYATALEKTHRRVRSRGRSDRITGTQYLLLFPDVWGQSNAIDCCLTGLWSPLNSIRRQACAGVARRSFARI